MKYFKILLMIFFMYSSYPAKTFIETIKGASVFIFAHDENRSGAVQGSGSIIKIDIDQKKQSLPYLILTARHVILNRANQPYDKVIAVFKTENGKKSYRLEAAAISKEDDIALFYLAQRYENKQEFALKDSDFELFEESALFIGNSDSIQETDVAYTIGYPNIGIEEHVQQIFKGTITGKHKGNYLFSQNFGHGLSGGPLINEKLEVVGICMAISSPNDNTKIQANFVLPINTVSPLIAEIEKEPLTPKSLAFEDQKKPTKLDEKNDLDGFGFVKDKDSQQSIEGVKVYFLDGISASDYHNLLVQYTKNPDPSKIEKYTKGILSSQFDGTLYQILGELKKDKIYNVFVIANGYEPKYVDHWPFPGKVKIFLQKR